MLVMGDVCEYGVEVECWNISPPHIHILYVCTGTTVQDTMQSTSVGWCISLFFFHFIIVYKLSKKEILNT